MEIKDIQINKHDLVILPANMNDANYQDIEKISNQIYNAENHLIILFHDGFEELIILRDFYKSYGLNGVIDKLRAETKCVMSDVLEKTKNQIVESTKPQEEVKANEIPDNTDYPDAV